MLEVCRLAKCRDVPIQMSQPLMNRRITSFPLSSFFFLHCGEKEANLLVSDHLDITFEVLHVHRVEAHNRRIQPDVGLRQRLAE